MSPVSATSTARPTGPAPAARPPRAPAVLGGCQAPAREHAGGAGCWCAAADTLGARPEGPLFWRLDTYLTAAAAAAARGPWGPVVESLGKVWLYTIAPAAWRPAADARGERVATIGSLGVERGGSYTARYMEATFPPGFRTPSLGHRRSGPEAWYVLTGPSVSNGGPATLVGRPGR